MNASDIAVIDALLQEFKKAIIIVDNHRDLCEILLSRAERHAGVIDIPVVEFVETINKGADSTVVFKRELNATIAFVMQHLEKNVSHEAG